MDRKRDHDGSYGGDGSASKRSRYDEGQGSFPRYSDNQHHGGSSMSYNRDGRGNYDRGYNNSFGNVDSRGGMRKSLHQEFNQFRANNRYASGGSHGDHGQRNNGSSSSSSHRKHGDDTVAGSSSSSNTEISFEKDPLKRAIADPMVRDYVCLRLCMLEYDSAVTLSKFGVMLSSDAAKIIEGVVAGDVAPAAPRVSTPHSSSAVHKTPTGGRSSTNGLEISANAGAAGAGSGSVNRTPGAVSGASPRPYGGPGSSSGSGSGHPAGTSISTPRHRDSSTPRVSKFSSIPPKNPIVSGGSLGTTGAAGGLAGSTPAETPLRISLPASGSGASTTPRYSHGGPSPREGMGQGQGQGGPSPREGMGQGQGTPRTTPRQSLTPRDKEPEDGEEQDADGLRAPSAQAVRTGSHGGSGSSPYPQGRPQPSPHSVQRYGSQSGGGGHYQQQRPYQHQSHSVSPHHQHQGHGQGYGHGYGGGGGHTPQGGQGQQQYRPQYSTHSGHNQPSPHHQQQSPHHPPPPRFVPGGSGYAPPHQGNMHPRNR